MKNYKPTIIISSFLAFAFAFLIFYLPAFVFELPSAFGYISIFLRDLFLALMPVVLSLVVTRAYAEGGVKRAMLNCTIAATPYLAYAVPYYYVYFAGNGYGGYQTVFMLLLQMLSSYVVSFLNVAICAFAAVFSLDVYCKRHPEQTPDITKKCDTGSIFAFDEPINASVFSACVAAFLIMLVYELYDTVNYLINYAGSYRIGEIIYIVCRYFFILGVLFISYYITRNIRERISD